jgi:hypothetical protein
MERNSTDSATVVGALVPVGNGCMVTLRRL